METDKRMIMALALSFGVLILWRVFLVKEPPVPPQKAAPAQAVVTPAPVTPHLSRSRRQPRNVLRLSNFLCNREPRPRIWWSKATSTGSRSPPRVRW